VSATPGNARGALVFWREAGTKKQFAKDHGFDVEVRDRLPGFVIRPRKHGG
jgi:uncharacterized protein (DUF924 family)